MNKVIIIITLSLIYSASIFSQSKVAAEFEENAKGYKFFAYQSVLRILNQERDPDFNLLIRDLDHIRVVTTDSVGVLAKESFARLDEGIQNEGFEEILTFDNKEYKCHVYELSPKSKKTTWVATFYMDGRAGLFEMVGSLNVKYLNALSGLNMDRLREMVPELENLDDWD